MNFTHCLVIAVFTCLVGPFGGFFASALKRAFEIKGCDINWKEGKDVTKKIIEKRERVRTEDKPGAKKEYKVIKQEIHDYDSIFNVFISKQAPDGYFEGP